MKSIMSINRKFMEYSPKDLIEIVKSKSELIDGFEISINYNDNDELNYLKELAFECSKNNMFFQVHGNSSLDIDTQVSFFKELYSISDELGYKINVVLHSVTGKDNDESIILTTNYLNELSEKIDNSKTIISLENLNDTYDDDRLDLEQITPIAFNNENIYCTYDIGHVIADYGKITDIDENMIPLLTNIHIHTHNGEYSQGFDHKPIFKNDEYWNEIIKGITLLKLYKYDGPIVFEYDLYACPGDTTLDKIYSYIESMEFVTLRIK